MGSCKFGWSGRSISCVVVSDASHVRWLLVAASHAPRPSSRRALAVARICCPIVVVVAAQLVNFVWSVAGGRRVAAVAPAAHAAATAGCRQPSSQRSQRNGPSRGCWHGTGITAFAGTTQPSGATPHGVGGPPDSGALGGAAIDGWVDPEARGGCQ